MTISHYEPAPTELAPIPDTDGTIARWTRILPAAAMLADRIANTEFVSGAMRGKPDVITAAILYGDEIGVGPMQALASIHVVDGRPGPSSELMRAMIFRAGHHMQVTESTGEVCTMWGRRAGQTEATTITWTIEMARTAGLASRANWRNYPRALLLARCSSELARVLFPDVIKGLGHLTDDDVTVQDFDQWAEAVATSPPAPTKKSGTTVKRTRQTVPPPRENPVPTAIDGPETGRDGSPGTPPPATVTPTVAGPGDLPPPADIPDPWDGKDPWATPAPTSTPETVQGRPVVETPLPPVDDANPPDDDAKAGDRLLRAVFAGLHKIGAADDDALRHAIASTVAGRRIESFAHLSRREALKMIGVLSDLETGTLTLEIGPDGAVSIHRKDDAP